VLRAVLDANVFVSAFVRPEGPYIAAAIVERASFVVSGDSDLLDIKAHVGVRIVNPRAFLDLL
jgi:predicted nucleic acid-binding protein